ncbi:MAG: hypothetical protein QOJ23_1162 [Actinomycetota bacterium]|jgi:hypothetical protein|nr:hypothetical protein [Actinomycetota bacterium]
MQHAFGDESLSTYPPRARRLFWALLVLAGLLFLGIAVTSLLGLAGGCINGCAP